MTPKPLLILGDSPSSTTGLGRIARELATCIHSNMQDVFRVATAGCGGTGSSCLDFLQYTFPVRPGYVVPELPEIWKDFAGNEDGIIFVIWNPSWLGWLPEKRPHGAALWLYAPVDGHCSGGKLPDSMRQVFEGFDRVLAYTKYGSTVIGRTTGVERGEYLPHGINANVFFPRDQKESKSRLLAKLNRIPVGQETASLDPSIFLVGVVATNSPRKDWHLAFKTCQVLLRRGVKVGMWAHTDAAKKHWDLLDLAERFDMKGRLILTTHNLDDDTMASAYSACDVTLGIGSGEGWGYPLAESLACGVPVIHGRYAGGADFVPASCLVEPAAFRGEGFYGILRPVYHAAMWADAVQKNAGNPASLPDYIKWTNAWEEWKKWLLKGVNQ